MDIGDIIAYIKVILRELWLHKFKVLLLSAFVGFAFLWMGVTWQPQYQVEATLKANKRLIDIEGTGNTEDKASVVRDGITNQILYEAIKEAYSDSAEFEEKDYEAISNSVRERLTITNLGDRYIKLQFDDVDAGRASNMLGLIADKFISQSRSSRQAQSQLELQQLQEEEERLLSKLRSAEAKLEAFKQSTKEDGTEEEARQKVIRLKNEMEALNLEIADMEVRINSLRQQIKKEETGTESNYLLSRIRQLEAEREALLVSVTEKHPDVVRLTHQINDAKEMLNNSMANPTSLATDSLVNPLRDQLRAELAQAQRDLSTNLRRLEFQKRLLEQENNRLDRIAEKASELSNITRTYNITKRNYDDIANQVQVARIASNINSHKDGTSYILEKAPITPLLPVGIRFAHFAIAGIVLAVLVPIGVIFLYVFVDPRLRFVSELKEALPESVQLMAIIPHETSPVGRRLVRSDMMMLFLMGGLMLATYIGVTIAFYQGVFSNV